MAKEVLSPVIQSGFEFVKGPLGDSLSIAAWKVGLYHVQYIFHRDSTEIEKLTRFAF